MFMQDICHKLKILFEEQDLKENQNQLHFSLRYNDLQLCENSKTANFCSCLSPSLPIDFQFANKFMLKA